jgi:hypothetical protein
MSDSVLLNEFKSGLFELFEEAFTRSHGLFLDRGTSIFETLATVSAEEASRPVGERCATIAAQVAHINFYLEILMEFIQGRNPGKVDWGEIWRTVGAVTPDEWDASQAKLRATYESVLAMAHSYPNWETPNAMGGAMGIIAHSAYHLGEIRQALCTVRDQA